MQTPQNVSIGYIVHYTRTGTVAMPGKVHRLLWFKAKVDALKHAQSSWSTYNRIEPQINVSPLQAQGAGLKSTPAQVEPIDLISDKRQA